MGTKTIKTNITTDVNDKRIWVGSADSSAHHGDFLFRVKGVTKSNRSSSDYWYYVIHDNGIAECWARIPFSSCAVSTGWSSYYAGDLCGSGKPWGASYSNYLTFPITFQSTPVEEISGESTVDYSFWVYKNGGLSTTHATVPSLGRFTSATVSGFIDYYVIGVVA